MDTTSHANRRGARLLGVILALALVMAACGNGDDAVDATASERSSTSDVGDDGASSDLDASTEADTGGLDEAPAVASTTTAGARAESADGGEGAGGDVAPEQSVGLRAGSVDDNEEWEAYLRYREDFARLGIPVAELDVSGRRLLTVVDADGAPVHDATVEIGTTTLRTGTDGRVVYLGDADAGGQQSEAATQVTVTHGTASVTAPLDAARAQTITIDTTRSTAVKLDLHFLIDATGSMDDEIERLKANMVGVAERIDALEGQPDVRFALTSYRDEGDEYVARTVDFTADVDRFVESLRAVVADGGGDTPEAFNEAFAEAVTRPSWRNEEGVVRLVVLVADAPPHVGRGPSYADTIGLAAAAGIRVFPVASSGTDDQAEYIFRQVAQATLGRFVFLSYGADGAAVGSSSNVDEVGYDVLSLDDLVVRLVEEELAPLG